VTWDGQQAPAAWYPDPAGGGGWRWWDGSTWTAHVRAAVAPGFGPTPAEYEGSRKAAATLRAWYPIKTVSAVIGIIGVAVTVRKFIDLFDDFDRTTRTNGRPASVSFSLGPNLLLQLVGVAALVVLILQIVWLLRTASFARSMGLPGQSVAPRRTAGLAAASLVIPIVNLWWPWQSICDCLPLGHPSRRAVNRWWALVIVSALVGIAGVVLAFIPFALAMVGFLMLAALPVAELFALRHMLDEIASAHEQVARAAGLLV
jgi:hypothetical protein